MNWFDAVNMPLPLCYRWIFHQTSSIGYWDSALIQYIIIVFRILAGINFSMYYYVMKARLDKIRVNEEFRYYLVITLVSTLLILISILPENDILSFSSIERAFRDSLFTVSSLITTTGYVTADYDLWKPVTWIILLITMMMGASAGSKAGGIKTVRIVIIAKYCYYEFKRIVHPNAIIPVRYNGHLMKEDITTRVLAFVLLYFMIVAIGAIVLSFNGMGFKEALSGMITSLSDVGPGLGEIGPTKNFYYLSDFAKWFLAIIMLIGRLELFTVLLILTPAFWKKIIVCTVQ